MRARLSGILSFLCFLLLFDSFGHGTNVDAKPTKITVRADDGIGIVCEVRGEGDTALILLHGWCGTREFWKHQVDALADDYRVVAFDQAGHGESGKDREKWTIDGLAADVEAVVNELGLRRVILVGHSMGGPISLAAAKRMPGKVVAVIGVDTLQNAEHEWPEEQTKEFLAGFERDFRGTLRTAMKGMAPENVDPELLAWLTTLAESQDPKMALGLMRNLSIVDEKALMMEAKVPVRCINSAPGFQFAIPTDSAINKKYCDYSAVIMEGVGHFPMLEKPVEFNEKLRDVLKEFAPAK
jgi:pimeloyl-ACP methyl ester carboxylesterase